jgi:hypothetical protein
MVQNTYVYTTAALLLKERETRDQRHRELGDC